MNGRTQDARFLHGIATRIMDGVALRNVGGEFNVTSQTVAIWFRRACYIGNPRFYHSLCRPSKYRLANRIKMRPFRMMKNSMGDDGNMPPTIEDLKEHGWFFLNGLESKAFRGEG